MLGYIHDLSNTPGTEARLSHQGKQISPEAVELVIRLKQHFDSERKNFREVSTRNPTKRTAEGLGLGIATVKRIMSRQARGQGPRTAQRPGRPASAVDGGVETVVRAFVRAENLRGSRVSIERVRSHLVERGHNEVPKMTLWRALKRWGFTYGQGRRRDSLREQDHVIRARRAYLRQRLANRGPRGPLRPEIYLDETYINKNHSARLTWYPEEDGPWVNKPSGVGPRLIVVHAMSRHGWIRGRTTGLSG